MIVTAASRSYGDVAVQEGKVVAIGRELPDGDSEFDLRGQLLLPGGVDTHVHLDQPAPGARMCDDFPTGTASAAAGGTTTVICFAWQSKGESLADVHHQFKSRASSGSLVDYAFHLTITDPTPKIINEELPALIDSGERSIKVFMTYDGVRLVDGVILQILSIAKEHDALVCVHAEHHEIIEALTKKLLDQGKTAPKYHALAKPMVAEREAVSRVIALAEVAGAAIQIFHVSGAESAFEVQRAQERNLPVSAETCVHYLVLTEDDLDRPGFEGAKYVFGPPARTPKDHDALWSMIRRGVIDVISSDHSPFRYNDPSGKMVNGDSASFDQIPNGIPGLAARLPILFSEGVSKNRISLEEFVALTSTNPAKRFGLYPQKGTIAVGSDADFVVIDPHKRVKITNSLMHHGSDYTPFEGIECIGWPTATFLRGTMIFDGTTITGCEGYGQYLSRKRVEQNETVV